MKTNTSILLASLVAVSMGSCTNQSVKQESTTDSVREWAYDRNSSIGHLEKGLDDASKYGWIVVDMKNDLNVIYPFQQK